jgi:hypothetical protein
MGEPDPRLFDEGATYTELKPSDRLRLDTARVGILWNQSLQQEADREDALYLARSRS